MHTMWPTQDSNEFGSWALVWSPEELRALQQANPDLHPGIYRYVDDSISTTINSLYAWSM